MMGDLWDGVIGLGGGWGRLEELVEMMRWKELGVYVNAIMMLNMKGF